MLKTLLKKQMLEVNRGLFVSQKTGKSRSKSGAALCIIGYAVLMIGVLGGMFGYFGSMVCQPLVEMGYGWLYFNLFAFVALLLGTFGSVFNTYSSLYAAKDNDLLFSLPIKLKDIIISRLASVYLLGLGFSAVAFLPGFVVYLIYFKPNASLVAGQLVALLVISIVVLILSCLLGLLVAKIATKVKSKTFISVVSSLVFIVIYYVFYFKAQGFLNNIVENAGGVAASLQGTSKVIYDFGMLCMGDWKAMGVFTLCSIAILVLLIRVISMNFMKLATTKAASKKIDTRLKSLKVKNVKSAVFVKEAGRLLSSSNYILNCGIGLIFIPAIAIAALLNIGGFMDFFLKMAQDDPEYVAVMFISIICMMASMINTAAPSVSLEGNTHWISQTLPVDPWIWLREKMMLEWGLAAFPTLFAQVCILLMLKLDLTASIAILVLPQLFIMFSSLLDINLSVYNANYTWSNELYPIKRSLAVTVALFSGWVFAGAFFIVFLVIDSPTIFLPYIAIWAFTLVVASILLYLNVRKNGVNRYITSY